MNTYHIYHFIMMVGRRTHAPNVKDMQLMSSEFNDKGSAHLMLRGARALVEGTVTRALLRIVKDFVFPAILRRA